MNVKPISAKKNGGLWILVLLASILGALFWQSFLPGYVDFANDGPLGVQNADWLRLPYGLTGTWVDLNDVGSNAGAFPPNLSTMICWILGPVGYSKFLAPIAMFILGLGAWTFFRQLKLTPLAAISGALAASLTSTFFSDACWGTAPHQIAFGMDFLALALIVSNSSETPAFVRWTRLALAGFAIGINVTEGADIGAIFSMLVATFVFFKAVADESGPALVKAGRGILRVAVIALFAGFIAVQTVVSLVGTQIVGIVGMGQDTETKARHWDEATQWSLPKIETLGIIVPGLFGYRMDTPKDMMESLQKSYEGGNYWGAVGRDPALDRFFESGQKGTPSQGWMRFSGTGNYAGVLVVLLAIWTVAQSLRRQNSVFSETHRRFIWFWTAVLIVSLLLAFGRFAPFYALVYKLPYFSTIRNPVKFLFVLSWALVIVFTCGIHGLSRRYLEIPSINANPTTGQLKIWWTKVRGFDRNWTSACVVAWVGSLLAWLIYAQQKTNLVSYLKMVGFPDENMAGQIAAFSVSQVGWFILFLALSTGLLTLVLSGAFAGRRAKWGGIFLGALLVLDLGRADLPWIIHWNYKQKYDIDPNDSAKSTNPLINFLRDKPYEHRVAYGLPWPLSTPPQFGLFDNLLKIEWMQHHFPYYNIQSLDLVQRPRLSADLAAFEGAFQIGIKRDSSGQLVVDSSTFPRVTRRWELTNTRYLLGPAGLLELLNDQFDPLQHRFRITQQFDIALKPGVEQYTKLEELTAVPSDNGPYALFDFTGALPRAKLYSHWQISTNDTATLQTLASTNFDARQTVLVSMPLPVTPAANATNENSGTVEYKRYVPDDPVFKGKRNGLWKQSGYCYAPKDMMFDAKTTTPSVLLLNDKFEPNWRVFVDGKPAELLRCNFIMRGVYLTPGTHTVEFQFSLPNRPLYISLVAIGIGILLCGFLIFSTRRNARPATRP